MFHVPGDNDSSLGDFSDELNSFTTSLSPSVTNYPTENGRRYHAFRPGVYILPNDEAELERLDIAHFMVKKALGDKLYLAPIPQNVKSILDVGTGTGIWAIEMGEIYPGAEVLGNDLSPVQPSWVPPNVKFEVDDVESPWTYTNPFDFIFSRYLCSSIADWPKLTQSVYDNLKPGGWAEFQDFDLRYYSEDGTYTPEHETSRWLNILLDLSAKNGREPNPGPLLEGWMKDAGFTNVVHRKIKLPIGPWPKDTHQKEVGLFNLVQILDGLEGFSFRLMTHILKWQPEEVEVLCAKVRNELKSKSMHAILDYHVCYGQKPEA
ncbi:S-adenosyl-L-methionine-dependent methyltransferase [Lepidopterella palustris CBS 459.81]|uniref:S-adenosyl-L-methionine-dependent methyltransferase n=1 Tax=Lepidopterella palustris CBS 459.81 TaxID=1314670 RepID=A0A8E2JKI7_9PEZI|nr:S-adenosyl-L-methionine-dependent methyltransferase [Lepidopterella palustris CBS 459.81]